MVKDNLEWILCPICGNKTRDRIREDTILENYPLYCPKCKQESLIMAKQLHIFICRISYRQSQRKNYLDVIGTKDRADVLSLYNEYVTFGAFPELVDIKNKRAFLSSIYQTIYLGDIITRNKISNDLP